MLYICLVSKKGFRLIPSAALPCSSFLQVAQSAPGERPVAEKDLSYKLLVQTGPLSFLLVEGKPEGSHFSLWLSPLHPTEGYYFEHSEPKGG